MPIHRPSRVGLAHLCEAFCADDSGEEKAGEIELELGEAVVVRVSTCRARNGLLTSPSWSPSRIQPQMNEPIRPPLFFLCWSLGFYWGRISLFDLLMR